MLRVAGIAVILAGFVSPVLAGSWTLEDGMSGMMPAGHSSYMLQAYSDEGRLAAFSCNTFGPRVGFAVQIGFGGLKLTNDGYGRKMAIGKEAPVQVTWLVDGKAVGKARWKRSNDVAVADDQSVQKLLAAVVSAKSSISFKAANTETSFSAKGIGGLTKMLKRCR